MQEALKKNDTAKRKTLFSRLRKFVVVVLLISLLSGSVLTVNERKAEGFFCFCIGIACDIPDVIISTIFFFLWYIIWDPIIKKNIRDHILHSEGNWIVEKFFIKFFLPGLREMTTFLSAMGMYQMHILGSFFDAKNQLETQRLFWRLSAEAHIDYQPSEDFCWFGTNSKGMAATEDRANYNRSVMAKRTLARQLGNFNANAANGAESDKEGRWRKFVNTYCDTRDNNWSEPPGGIVEGTGLDLACDHDGAPGGAKGATDPERANRDIDYTRLIDQPRTLEVNFDDPHASPVPKDEEDVLAMASNLYGNNVLTRKLNNSVIKVNPSAQDLYMLLRSVAAKRTVAENTFNAIVGLKSAGTGSSMSSDKPKEQVRQYMGALMKDLMANATDEEIYKIIGENPSYYAQLEVLAKRIYQNQDFYSNLYDAPANIERKSVALKAVDSMLERELFESELRQEMVMSVLLTSEMRQRYRDANRILQRAPD